jgi:hypothetical protein
MVPLCCVALSRPGVIGYYDFSPRDCTLTLPELREHPDLMKAIAADLMIDNQPAVSVGVRLRATGAAFTAPE